MAGIMKIRAFGPSDSNFAAPACYKCKKESPAVTIEASPLTGPTRYYCEPCAALVIAGNVRLLALGLVSVALRPLQKGVTIDDKNL